jgi:hypothetical protein
MSLKLHAQWAHEQIDKLKEAAEKEATEAQRVLASYDLGGIEEIKDYRDVWHSHFTMRSEPRSTNDLRVETEALFVKVKERREENAKAIKHNQRILESIISLMKSIGLREEETYRKSARSMKTYRRRAAWLVSLGMQIPTTDGFNAVENDYRAKLRRFEESEKKEKQQKRQVELEESRKQALIKQGEMLGRLRGRYDCEAGDGLDELLERILQRNKYLFLAHYLLKNRDNWSDGYNYAQTGLDGFVAATGPKKHQTTRKNDQDIIDEITGLIENWDGDGRVFRDCEYNYDVLFKMVKNADSRLYEDYEEVTGLIEG